MHVEAAHIEARLEALRVRRRRQARVRMLKRLALVSALLVAGGFVVAGIVYAGSPGRLAEGEEIAGVDVGGLQTTDARRLLERRAAAVAGVPLVLRVDGKTYRVRPGQIGLKIDWAAAIASAKRKGDGLGPIRGFRRMLVRAFGAELTPPARVDGHALDAVLGRVSRGVGAPHRDAAVRLRGLHPVVVPGRTGRVLDRRAARALIVSSFAELSREPVALPLRSDPPGVTAAMLARVAARARTALSAPVRLQLGDTRYRLPRWRIAQLLELPAGGARELRIAGPKANAYFLRLQKTVNTPAKDAQFEVVSGGKIRIAPSVDARVLDVPATAKSILAAALSPASRVAPIVVGTKHPSRTTREAQAMGVQELVSSFTTLYGGVPNRIHNVQLVSRLIDNTLIAPGKTFSFNETTGARTPDKGFEVAPVIINGELQNALGGGVCQVSTTVFNAAYEAGLDITARTNHALYISHYPQGRDATVNYPDIDLRFVNDTGHWLLLRTFVSASSLTVNLYGTSPHRRVESETGALRVTGPPPTETVKDPKLPKGKKVIEEAGSPSLATSVHRKVYSADGKVLHDNVWYSSYRGEKRVIRVGTKPKPKPKPKPKTGAPVPPPFFPGGF